MIGLPYRLEVEDGESWESYLVRASRAYALPLSGVAERLGVLVEGRFPTDWKIRPTEATRAQWPGTQAELEAMFIGTYGPAFRPDWHRVNMRQLAVGEWWVFHAKSATRSM